MFHLQYRPPAHLISVWPPAKLHFLFVSETCSKLNHSLSIKLSWALLFPFKSLIHYLWMIFQLHNCTLLGSTAPTPLLSPTLPHWQFHRFCLSAYWAKTLLKVRRAFPGDSLGLSCCREILPHKRGSRVAVPFCIVLPEINPTHPHSLRSHLSLLKRKSELKIQGLVIQTSV
jgi:hypothetical protein